MRPRRPSVLNLHQILASALLIVKAARGYASGRAAAEVNGGGSDKVNDEGRRAGFHACQPQDEKGDDGRLRAVSLA